MRKIFIIAISCQLLAIGLKAQVADSLLSRLVTDKQDTNRVNDCVELAAYYSNLGKTDTTLKLAGQAETLAQQIHFSKGIMAAYNCMGATYQVTGNFNKAIESYTNGLKAAETTGDKIHVAKFNGKIGTVYSDMGDFDKALQYYFIDLQAVQAIGDKKAVALVAGDIGNAYEYQGDYIKALEYNFKALQMDEENGEKRSVAIVNGNIGNIYVDEKDYKSALSYYYKALKVDSELNNKNSIAVNLGNIGNIYGILGERDKALDFALKALKIDEEIGNKEGIAINTGNIGNMYSDRKDYDKARGYMFKALDAYTELGSKQGIAATKDNMGGMYLEQKNYAESEKYFLQSAALADSLHYLPCLEEDYQDLSKLYAETGKWQKAYEASAKYNAIKDSMFSQDKSQEIGRLEAKAGYDKQLALQKAEEAKNTAIAEENSKKQKLIMLLISALALIISLVALLFFRSFKNAQKEKKLAQQEKSLMELRALRAQMNPHFIFNAISSIQHFTLQNDTEAAQKYLSKFSKLIRGVLENSKYESIRLSEELQMLQLYIELEQLRFSNKFSYEININESVDAERTLIAPLIIQPFVENAIWHGLMHLQDRQGKLSVTIEKQGDALKCIVDDNGIGRKRAMEIRNAKMHRSMGISITQERMLAGNMNVNFIDKENPDGTPAGTTVEIVMNNK
ncbi:MAG: tetratricopeptide repeat protein [Bacteroidia bacterium]